MFVCLFVVVLCLIDDDDDDDDELNAQHQSQPTCRIKKEETRKISIPTRLIVVYVVVVCLLVCLLACCCLLETMMSYKNETVPRISQQSADISTGTGRIQEDGIPVQTAHQMEPLQSRLKAKNVKSKQVVRLGLN